MAADASAGTVEVPTAPVEASPPVETFIPKQKAQQDGYSPEVPANLAEQPSS
jgi:hypothetical protein